MASTCLSGVQILCAAPTEHELGGLRSKVERLGGIPVSLEEVASAVQPSYLVATSVLTEAYTVRLLTPNYGRGRMGWRVCKGARKLVDKRPWQQAVAPPKAR
jgi:hypothetical protein